MIEFELKTDYIELIKLLKAVSIADSGAKAKEIVQEGLVKVNGTKELRMRCKLYDGFEVECFGKKIIILKSK